MTLRKPLKPVKVKLSLKPLNKIPPLSKLKPKENCKLCHGRGTLAFIPNPNEIRADTFRVVYPCPCVKMIIKWKVDAEIVKHKLDKKTAK